jgi:putative ABC transport system permease protein
MLRQDLRFAVRSLTKSRVFVVVAIASLTLGIGATSTVFSLFDAVALKPLPYRDSEHLVDVHETSVTKLCAYCSVGTSYGGFLDWRARARSFDDMQAYRELPLAVSGTEAAERVSGAIVTPGFFHLLGMRPALGRAFIDDDGRDDAPPVVVLSDALWRSHYGADSSVVGRSIRVNGIARTVVGIVPSRFALPEFAQLWLPLRARDESNARDARELGVIAHLAPTVTFARAEAEMRSVAAAIALEHPESEKDWSAGLTPLREELAGEVGPLYAVMLGAVVFVLLIVCANIAGLLLARGTARRKEIAIRLALGASRGQVVRQLLAESVMLAIVGGALGVMLALWAVDLTASAIGTRIPNWIVFTVDGRVLAFTVAVSIATGVVFGLFPALRTSRPDIHDILKDGGGNASAGVRRSRARALLVIGELALALVLLAGAALLTKSVIRVSAFESGYDPHGVASARLEFLDHRYDDVRQLALGSDRMLTSVQRIPSVAAAALERDQFIAGFGGVDTKIQAEGVAQVRDGVSPRFAKVVSPDYFAALRIPIRAGRPFTATDRVGSAPVVIVNAQLARDLWPNENALGRRIRLGTGDSLPWRTVVGVVGDLYSRGEVRARNWAYVPFAQAPGSPMSIIARAASGDASLLVPSIREAVRGVDPDIPLLDAGTMEQSRERNYSPYRMYALMMSAFAALAMFLAAIGVYGVVAYSVNQRTREIGVRIALGAERRHVLMLITGQGARLALVGAVVGIVMALGATRALRWLLFGADTIDPAVYLSVSALLGLTAVLASYLPARRAASIDPLQALRVE